MDVLLEMTPGTGWLARENDRVVFLPGAETIEVAHDVIEPLLVPRSIDEAFEILASWLNSSRPLPPVLLIGLASEPRVMSHMIETLSVAGATQRTPAPLALDNRAAPVNVGPIRSMSFGDPEGLASGMLIEGVIRAGAFRVHLHANASARTSREVELDPTPAVLQLHLDEYSVEVGAGIVLGRWPYKHADYDPDLEPLILADPAVSRLHAEIRPTENGAIVIDKNSHNGTWVSSSRTGQRVRLKPAVPHTIADGDVIMVGDTVVTLGGRP